ncbi:MAG: hypothetical protein RMJ37_01745 [Spirochaetia bacterium]|nr:hypothetical protein [Spirochaetota bacterium]MCX8096599.1 hypothetical protein [Spirochaetota bacterium]MDW8112046.1 hypothetical protein [Spirochaetia bacterium]
MKFLKSILLLTTLLALASCSCEYQEEKVGLIFVNPKNAELVKDKNLEVLLRLEGNIQNTTKVRVFLNERLILLSEPKEELSTRVELSERTNNLVVVLGDRNNNLYTNQIVFLFVPEVKPKEIVKRKYKVKPVKVRNIPRYEDVKPELKPEIVLPQVEEIRESEYISSVELNIDDEGLDYYKDYINLKYKVVFNKEFASTAIQNFKMTYIEINDFTGQNLFSESNKEPVGSMEIDITSLPTGFYSVSIRAEDIKGKFYESSRWIKVDKTPPTIVVEGLTNKTIVRGIFEFYAKFSDEDVGLSNYSVSIGNQTIQSRREKDRVVFTFDSTKFKNGSYEIFITALDKLGNTSKVKFSVLLDNWFEEIVDSTSGSGFNLSSFVDSDNNIHLAYYNFNSKNLFYAFRKNQSDRWIIEVVDKDVDSGRYPSIFVDNFNRIHISYTYINERWDDEDLRYAIKEGREWKIFTLDNQDKAGRYTSIVVDERGVPHISYYNYTLGSLRYLTYNIKMDRWEVSVPDSYENVGSDTSISVFNNVVHIVYLDNANGDIKYCRKGVDETEAGWRFEVIDADGKVGYYSSMKIDKFGNIHVSYYDSTLKALKYAVKTKGKWNIQVVDRKDDPGRFTSIFVDEKGNPHISYFVESKKEIRYAYYDGSKWDIQVVSSMKAGGYSSIIVYNGKPMIFFYDVRSNQLKLARK